MNWITAADIDNWTRKEPRRAQEILPLLVWKLILASCDSIINDIHFPFGKAIQYNGYDGILNTDFNSPFFPVGTSVWEIGTDANILEKFNNDYEKRSAEPNGIDQKDTTFCFVSSRIWNHKKGIAETTEGKMRAGIWKSVRIIDANCLQLWLDACPSVHLWFSRVMDSPFDGVQDIRSFWEEMACSTYPQLTSVFFLYKRESIVNKLQQVCCSDKPNQIVLIGDSGLEATLCIAAEIFASDDVSVLSFGEKCVVAHSLDALNQVDSHYRNAIIIPTFYFTESSVSTRRNTLVIPINRSNPLEKLSRNNTRIELPARTLHQFCESIEKLGFDSNDAFEMGHMLHCSFPALFRQLNTNPLNKVPEWSRCEGSEKLIPALFVGAWEERTPGDKEIISSLAGIPYDDYIASVHSFTKGENAPLFSVDHSYACISIGEMWDCLWERILAQTFNRFKECFLRVFNESDPTYELPEEQWFAAAIFGKSPSYSNQIKNGMIVSLILMIERDNEISSGFSDRLTGECNALIREIFESVDSLNKWRSISQYVPAFIEAAPDVVLSVLEREATIDDSPIWDLFVSSSDPLFGKNFYTHILWALETALWDKKYAVRSLRIIIALAEKKQIYKLSNSPEDTLYRVFCTWNPQGIFTTEERKVLLTDIVRNHKTIASDLVKKLLSPSHQVTYDISKPKWNSIEAEHDPVTYTEVAELKEFISSLYIDNISPCYEAWSTVISDLASFDSIAHLVEKCIAQSSIMSNEDILKICRDLALYISHNRKFKHDSNERIDEVERLYTALLPDTPKYYAHYFAYHFDGLNPAPYDKDTYDYNEERNALSIFQKEKIKEMVSNYGLESVLEIIPLIEDYPSYADVIVDTVLNGSPDWQIVFRIRESQKYLASCIVSSLYNKNGINQIVDEGSCLEGSDLGWALSCLPIKEDVTSFVDNVDCDICKQVYWENVRAFGVQTKNTEWVNHCIHSLLKYNRPYSVIDCFAYSEWNDPVVIMEVLSAALILYPSPEPSGLQLSQVGNTDIEKLFEKLYKDSVVPDLDIAKMELAYLKAFDIGFEPQRLIGQILTSPEIYIELLTSAYQPDNNEDDCKSNGIKDERKRFIEIASCALDRIHRIPGTTAGSTYIDNAGFSYWVSETTRLAKEKNYLSKHDIVLGKILSYSPVGQDGLWPAECVRKVFESPHSDSLERHFIIAKEKQRGFYYASSGINEERIAEDYKRQADGLQLLYPRTASILLRLSDVYFEEAKSERARELKGL